MGNFRKITIEQFKEAMFDSQDLADSLGAFHCEGITFRREPRRNGAYWYAFKKLNRKLLKQYIGGKWELRPERIESLKVRFMAMARGEARIAPVVAPAEAESWFERWLK